MEDKKKASAVDLIELAKQNPLSVEHYTVQQIVAICGDGNLRDNSICSQKLREFLALQSADRLAEYARYCLDEGFPKSGLVLQDSVNEIGKRLGYSVTHGRYQGATNQVGFHGLWFDGTNHIIVEVKTTDAYRINLDTIQAYADRIESASPRSYSLLIVVGRKDTGDLEAQVRGSRHAWSTRLISVDSLVKLMFIREELDDKNLIERIRRILLPFEYTRVDNIVDLVFDAQQESDKKAQTIDELSSDDAAEKRATGRYEFTPREQLEAKRKQASQAFFKWKSAVGQQLTKTNYVSTDNRLGITCAVSKRYRRDYQPYWYALHPQWLQFLRSKPESYFVLACMDRDEAYALPVKLLEEHLSDFNRTELEDKHYWHIALSNEAGRLGLRLSTIGKTIDLAPYSFRLT
jgi:hypothetical protein